MACRSSTWRWAARCTSTCTSSPAAFDHRSDKSKPLRERYGLAHAIRSPPGGKLQALFDGAERIEVNSLHGQGIDRLADRLLVEAMADDGTDRGGQRARAPGFALAVQWHPEWQVLENPWSRRLFAAFGAAARARAAARTARPASADATA